jgi:epoxide hydrolase 4
MSLLSKSYRVIALDLKGFNDSDKPDDWIWMMKHKYHPKTVCSELKLFLDALDISNVVIIGHDLGGLVGWFFAVLYPNYVSKLVSIAAPHPNFYWKFSKNALTSNYWCNVVQMPIYPEYELSNQQNFIAKFHPIQRQIIEPGALNFSSQDIRNTYKYIFNSAKDWRGPLNYFRNFMFYRVDPGLFVRCPTIFIIGNKDPNYNLEIIVKSGEFCHNSIIKIVDVRYYKQLL